MLGLLVWVFSVGNNGVAVGAAIDVREIVSVSGLNC